MNVAKGALRHGLMYDMLAQDTTMLDMRNASVLHLMRKFAVDEPHAKTVALVAENYLKRLAPKPNLLPANKPPMHVNCNGLACFTKWAAWCRQ